MTDEVRALYRVGRQRPPPGDGAPSDPAARVEIVEFLDAKLARPLFIQGAQRLSQIEQAIEQMTIPERVFIELEMRDREKNQHSSDYDPL